MSEPYDDYDGYLKANLRWFISFGVLLLAIAAVAYFASQPSPPAHRPEIPPSQTESR
ncbi:MAG: hypothetical protein IT577_04950 [Verrucomicrobiae bacterium]|nr:hypothetical protein [Verrucomicrobiae bacterium]